MQSRIKYINSGLVLNNPIHKTIKHIPSLTTTTIHLRNPQTARG